MNTHTFFIAISSGLLASHIVQAGVVPRYVVLIVIAMVATILSVLQPAPVVASAVSILMALAGQRFGRWIERVAATFIGHTYVMMYEAGELAGNVTAARALVFRLTYR